MAKNNTKTDKKNAAPVQTSAPAATSEHKMPASGADYGIKTIDGVQTFVPATGEAMATMSTADLSAYLEARREWDRIQVRNARASEATALTSGMSAFVKLHGEDGWDILNSHLDSLREKHNRAKISEDIKAKIEADLRNGADTSKDIAERYGVSLPTVSNMKKALGLVKTRVETATGTPPVTADDIKVKLGEAAPAPEATAPAAS